MERLLWSAEIVLPKVKEDMQRSMSLLWQWEHIAATSLLMDLRNIEVSLAQIRHRYSYIGMETTSAEPTT